MQLKQRHDLIPNLVATVQGYVAHERGTLEEVVKARNAATTAQGPAAQAAAEGALSNALGRLFALAEAYPDLKANQNFLQLQSDLSDSKTRSPRRAASSTMRLPNIMPRARAMPAALFAASLGFALQEFFNVDAAEKQAIEQS